MSMSPLRQTTPPHLGPFLSGAREGCARPLGLSSSLKGGAWPCAALGGSEAPGAVHPLAMLRCFGRGARGRARRWEVPQASQVNREEALRVT